MRVCGAKDAGRIDQRVEAAERLDGRAHAIDHRILIADVHLYSAKPVPGRGLVGLSRSLAQTVHRDVGGYHTRTFGQQPQRGRLADPRRRAGHQDPLALESIHLRPPRVDRRRRTRAPASRSSPAHASPRPHRRR